MQRKFVKKIRLVELDPSSLNNLKLIGSLRVSGTIFVIKVKKLWKLDWTSSFFVLNVPLMSFVYCNGIIPLIWFFIAFILLSWGTCTQRLIFLAEETECLLWIVNRVFYSIGIYPTTVELPLPHSGFLLILVDKDWTHGLGLCSKRHPFNPSVHSQDYSIVIGMTLWLDFRWCEV